MSDPLSTAVGIISLGLQVCGEIVSFCQAWQGFSEDIQSIVEKADGLRVPLKTLRDMIEDSYTTDPTLAKDLEQKAMCIERAIRRLKAATDRYTSSDRNTLGFQLRKAAYPFRKDGLRDMASDLDSVQLLLHTTLQILLQSWYIRQEQLPALESSAQIATQATQMTKDPSTGADQSEAGIEHEQSVAHQSRTTTNSVYASRSRPPVQGKTVIKISYYYCSSLLNLALKASFLVNKGAGGYSIAPLLHLQPLVGAEDSLGWFILNDFHFKTLIGCTVPPADGFDSLLDDTQRQLQQAFDLQKSTPFDSISFEDNDMSFFDAGAYLMLVVLSSSEPLVIDSFQVLEIPNIVKIIIRESEDELRNALDTGEAFPNDMINGISSLMDFAYGWPKGMKILLDAGADQYTSNLHLCYVEDNENQDIYHSVKLLLDVGCEFKWVHISQCQEYKHSGKLKSLLIKELAARRKRLWNLARSCLPARELPTLVSEEQIEGTSLILDIHAAEIYARLWDQGAFSRQHAAEYGDEKCFGTVYHFPLFWADTLEELYQNGFRGVNELDREGFMPLMASEDSSHTAIGHFRAIKELERMAWLVSNGADPYQHIPDASGTAAHHIGLNIIRYLLWDFVWRNVEFADSHEEYEVWERVLPDFAKDLFLLPTVTDGCVCACSVDGCTPVSIVLRESVEWVFRSIGEYPKFKFKFKELIKFFLKWIGENAELDWRVIRFFTFDALGLKHSCCVVNKRFLHRHFKLQIREEGEVQEILDEERFRLEDLETLLDELKVKFDELGQPVIEFLEGHWQTRMVEYLSQRDIHDEEHVIESRRLGIKLEVDEPFISDL
ncbi:hypothetical protein N7457_000344, partial [Penicillium paradoxum]|uniref:uncharacterized protein n=1 Tax=Penicillium paradoxum TaxID=176176 RepID=UPI002547E27F